MKNIFITGGSGLLGWDIAKESLKEDGSKLYLLVRGRKEKSARARIEGLIKKSYSGAGRKMALGRIEVIEGDISEKFLGMKKSRINKLCGEIDVIYHSAALCEFGVPWERIRKINVSGTKNALDFALMCKKNGQIQSFNYISSVAVAGKTGGVFYEDDLDIGQAFNNTYERSKFEAEKLVRSCRDKGFNISIYRPSVVTGNSKTGEVSNFQMLYQPLHIFSLGLFDKIPADRLSSYNLVPVNYVAKAVCLLSSCNKRNKNYHLTNPNTITLDSLLDIASSYFGFKKPEIIPEQRYDFKGLKGFKRKVIEPYLPYFNHKKITFDTTNFDKAIDNKDFSWPVINKSLLVKLFKYCANTGYIKRKK